MPSTEKPALDAKGRVRYTDAIAFLERTYGFNSSDYSGSHNYYGVWCEKHGKPRTPAEIVQQQRQWSEYCAAPDGERAEPAYENFWHWLLGLAQPLGGKLPSFFKLDIPEVLTTYDLTHAVLQQTLQEAVAARVQAGLAAVPADLHEAVLKQYAPRPTELQPFVRTILGYFQAEFGDVVKLDLRRS